MPAKDSRNDVISMLENLRGTELDPEEQAEIDEWNKGRQLSQIIVMPGWQVVLEMLASYAADANRRLTTTDPKDKDDVLAQHAVVFAATRIFNNFVEDVQSAVLKSRKMPETVRDGLRKVSPAPPESML